MQFPKSTPSGTARNLYLRSVKKVEMRLDNLLIIITFADSFRIAENTTIKL
jgi:hypothetical protein